MLRTLWSALQMFSRALLSITCIICPPSAELTSSAAPDSWLLNRALRLKADKTYWLCMLDGMFYPARSLSGSGPSCWGQRLRRTELCCSIRLHTLTSQPWKGSYWVNAGKFTASGAVWFSLAVFSGCLDFDPLQRWMKSRGCAERVHLRETTDPLVQEKEHHGCESSGSPRLFSAQLLLKVMGIKTCRPFSDWLVYPHNLFWFY